jgi:Putative Actinobacterial Holin-X, holin superfamily III
MHATTGRRYSLMGMIQKLADDVKQVIQQEVKLAKTEITEKLSKMGVDAVWLGVGGVVGLMGLLMFLLGLGFLAGFAFERSGVDGLLALAFGIGLMGVIVIAFGVVTVLITQKRLSGKRMVPEKTVQSVERLKQELVSTTGTSRAPLSNPAVERSEKKENETPQPSSEQVERRVYSAQTEMVETIDELSEELTPRALGRRLWEQVVNHPVESVLLGAASGLASYLLVVRQFRANHDRHHRRRRSFF